MHCTAGRFLYFITVLKGAGRLSVFLGVIIMENENNIEVTQPEQVQEVSVKKTVLKEVWEWVYSLGIAFLVVIVLKGFVFDVVKVDGNSMYPTLHHNDRLIVTKLGYEPQNGDIIILDRNYDNRQEYYAQLAAADGKDDVSWFTKLRTGFSKDEALAKIYYVKRVIATEGQTVDIREGKVYIDGEVLEEEYIDVPTPTGDYNVEYPVTVEEGHVFVMGDNRNNSLDSRFSSLGQVDADAVLGKSQFRFFPFNAIGKTK